MFFFKIIALKLSTWFFIFSIFVASSSTQNEIRKRQIKTELLEPSFKTTQCPGIIHTTSEGQRDVLHYVYTTCGSPTFLLARTDKGLHLNINWTKFWSNNTRSQEKSISFKNGIVHSSTIFIIDKLYIYNDPKDEVRMDHPNLQIISFNLSEFTWNLTRSHFNYSDNLVSFTGWHDIKSNETLNRKSNIIIEVLPSNDDIYYSELPHMHLTENLTQIKVTFLSLPDNEANFTNPRIGLGLIFLAPINQFKQPQLYIERSLSDELTPGAFTTLTWQSDFIKQMPQISGGNFIQWKPICYTDPHKSLISVTTVLDYSQINYNFSVINNFSSHPDLSWAFYGETMEIGQLWIAKRNVSFGSKGDKWYYASNYSTWTLSYGDGLYPTTTLTIYVSIAILIGILIPLVVLVLGYIYLYFRKKRIDRNGYEDITSSYPAIG